MWGILFGGGIACGFINTLAGGGSLVTMPLLIFLGIDPLIANATNRLALVVQNASSATGLWLGGIKDSRSIRWLAPAALFGALFGAKLSFFLTPALFKKILAIIMVAVAVPIVSKKDSFKKKASSLLVGKPTPLLVATFFVIGLYSGFIQIGSGIWSLLALFTIGKYSINHANSIKSQLLFLTTLTATILFIWHGQVLFIVSITLAVGNMFGAAIASWVATKYSLEWLRWFIFVGVLVAASRLFGLF